jgi:hypothetical protein
MRKRAEIAPFAQFSHNIERSRDPQLPRRAAPREG